MTCGTLIEFCNEDFPIPPRLPPPPPILSYYFEDNQLNSSFYCEFCSNLEASLDPLHKQFGDGYGGTGGLFSPSSQNLTFILFLVALLSAAVGSAVTVVWRKWFRCRDGGILSKAFGGSHSPHSADISASPDGRRRSRTASLGSGSALQNLQKRLSSSSFISRRSVYQHHPTNIISTHHRSGGATISNNTYCECPSNMMMMLCSSSTTDQGNNMNASGTSNSTTTSLSPCITSMNINPSAPTASTLSITGGNVYAELDPVSVQQPQHHPPLPPFPPPGEHCHHPIVGVMPIIVGPSNGLSATHLATIGSTPGSNQYVLSHRRRQPAPLPPIPAVPNEPVNQQLHHDHSIPTNNALNLSISNCNINGSSVSAPSPNKNVIVGLNGQIMAGVISSGQNVDDNINQMEMNDLNDIYYSDLDCKQIQF